ncbi:MAG: SxtJ family membrane protein [Planctomycetota bacterium]|jgi:hypothetical protein
MSTTRKDLRKFGIVVGGVFFALGAYFLWRERWDSTAGTVFFVAGTGLVLFGIALPVYLRPVYRAWMAFAHVLGWINTRILLGIIFYLGFTIARIGLWIARKDPMHRRPDNRVSTYWRDTSDKVVDASSLEHPF